jgi:hypothetical protein
VAAIAFVYTRKRAQAKQEAERAAAAAAGSKTSVISFGRKKSRNSVGVLELEVGMFDNPMRAEAVERPPSPDYAEPKTIFDARYHVPEDDSLPVLSKNEQSILDYWLSVEMTADEVGSL